MERTLGWLGHPESVMRGRLRPVAGLAYLVAALILGFLPTSRRARALAIGVSVLVTSALITFSESRCPAAGAHSGTRAYIDATYLPGDNLNVWLRDGFGGFSQTLARAGLLPYLLWDGWEDAAWDDAALVVLLDPRKAPASADERRLLRYVEEGGHLLVALGWEEAHPCSDFLARLGLRIENAPLGKVAGTSWRGQVVKFENAWPITILGPRETRCDVIARVGNTPCAVCCTRGRGRITLIGDSRFFRNSNLEGRSEIVPENLDFLRRFLAEWVGDRRGAPASTKTRSKGLKP
jgi:hypothetical protein